MLINVEDMNEIHCAKSGLSEALRRFVGSSDGIDFGSGCASKRGLHSCASIVAKFVSSLGVRQAICGPLGEESSSEEGSSGFIIFVITAGFFSESNSASSSAGVVLRETTPKFSSVIVGICSQSSTVVVDVAPDGVYGLNTLSAGCPEGLVGESLAGSTVTRVIRSIVLSLKPSVVAFLDLDRPNSRHGELGDGDSVGDIEPYPES